MSSLVLCKENAENFTYGNAYVKKQRGFVTPSPMMLMGGVIAVLASLALVFYNLYQGAVDDLATYRAQVEAAQEQVRLDNERKINELVAVNVRLESGWNDAVRALRDRPAIRVRPNSCPRTVPAVPGTPGKPDEATVEPASGAEGTITVEACEQIANDAVIDAANLVWLQEWVKQAHEATK